MSELSRSFVVHSGQVFVFAGLRPSQIEPPSGTSLVDLPKQYNREVDLTRTLGQLARFRPDPAPSERLLRLMYVRSYVSYVGLRYALLVLS